MDEKNELNELTEKPYKLGKFKATDVFVFATLLSKIGLGKMGDTFGKENVASLLKDVKGGGDAVETVGVGIGLKIAEVILGNLESCRDEVFTLLSHISGMVVEEVENLDAEIFIDMIFDTVKLPQFENFISRATRLSGTMK